VCRITAYLPSGRTPGRTRPLPSTGAPDRHRQLDLQLCCHIDNQVADEWQPARRDAVPGQPSEQFRKGFIHGIGDAVHGDDHPDSGVVLRGAHLDLRLVVQVAASVSTGMPDVTAGRPGTHRWRHGRDGPALPRQSACDLSGGCAAAVRGIVHEQRALDTSLTAQKYQFGTQFGQQRDGRVADHIGGYGRGLPRRIGHVLSRGGGL